MKPIIANINNTKVFIYCLNSTDFVNSILRISEAFVLEAIFGNKAYSITQEDYILWSKYISGENQYNSISGIYIKSYHIPQFYALYNSSMTKEEKAIIKILKSNNCFDDQKNKIVNKFAIIAINKEANKKKGITNESVLLHELSHALYDVNKSYRTFVNKSFEKAGELYRILTSDFLENRVDWPAKIEDEWAAYLIDGTIDITKHTKHAKLNINKVIDLFNNILWSDTTIILGPKNNLLSRYISKILKK